MHPHTYMRSMTPRTEPQRLKPEATARTAEPRPTIQRPNRKLRYCGGAKDHAPAKRQRPELGGGKQGGGEGGGDEAAFIEIGDGLCATPGCTLPDFHAGPCSNAASLGRRREHNIKLPYNEKAAQQLLRGEAAAIKASKREQRERNERGEQ